MSDKKYDQMFPVKIDLGRKEKPYDYPMSSSDSKKDKKKAKTITVYPSLYVDYVEGMEKLPEKGCIMIKYEVVGIDKRKDRYTGDRKGSLTLEVKCFCLPEKEESSDSLIDGMFSDVQESGTSSKDDEMDDEDED
jgi:hypothetical protein